jgi:hypothetical protein
MLSDRQRTGRVNFQLDPHFSTEAAKTPPENIPPQNRTIHSMRRRGHARLERERYTRRNLIDERTSPCACAVETTMPSLLRFCEKNPHSALRNQSGP